MKILLTGASGMLGTDLQRALSREHELVATDIAGGVMPLDITDREQVMRTVADVRPDLVIHSAAYTDVDGCERDPDRAFRVNGLGTWHIAAACARCDSAVLYVSTDFVFDGHKGAPYSEYDTPRPINHYGASKLAGEVHVRTLCPRHYIVRTAWLYGEHGKSFPRSILNAAREGKKLRVVSDQIGSPTFTADLAQAICTLIDNPLYGTYHITNSGMASWYELARRTLALAGMNNVEIKPIKSEEWPSPTTRPQFSVLRNYALELQGRQSMRPWHEALADFVNRISKG